MKTDRLSLVCFTAANLCLAASGIAQRQWVWLGIVVLLIILWPIRLKVRPSWMNHALFFADLALIIYAGINKATPALLIAAICFLLAAWETSDGKKLTDDMPLTDGASKFARQRLIVLAAVLGAAAVMAAVGLLISISLPFLVELLLGIAVMVCLLQFYLSTR